MHSRILIDNIVRQTTLLIAQLSTSAGLRAPLSHIADQVFLQLSKEIEAQGVSRNVAADMFGLALRSYQKKVQRLVESATERNLSLWEAVLHHLRDVGSAGRAALLHHFRRDDPSAVIAVLNDMVSSGVLFRTGTGERTLFGITPEQDYRKMLNLEDRDSVSALLWQLIYSSPGCTRKDLMQRLVIEDSVMDAALADLTSSGRVIAVEVDSELQYSAESLVLPVGAEHGWEAAVFDHYQAMVSALVAKLRSRRPRSETADVVGGATLSFDVHASHPNAAEVLGLLRRVREQVSELWDRVEAHNRDHPVSEQERQRIWFYFGQYAPFMTEDENE